MTDRHARSDPQPGRGLVDLYLGGSLASWVLDQANPGQVGVIVAADHGVAVAAQDRGFTVGAAPRLGWRILAVDYPGEVSPEAVEWYGADMAHWYPGAWAIAGNELRALTPLGGVLDVSDNPDPAAAVRELFSRWWPRIIAGERMPNQETVRPA